MHTGHGPDMCASQHVMPPGEENKMRNEMRKILITERKCRGRSTDGGIEKCISGTCGHAEIGRFERKGAF